MTELQQTYLFSVLGHTHTHADKHTHTHMWSGCKMTGTYFKKKWANEIKRENKQKSKSVGILWPKHWCQNNWTFIFFSFLFFFFFVASMQSKAKNSLKSEPLSLWISEYVCVHFCFGSSSSFLSSVNSKQMESEHTLGKATVFCL